jgi:hypothetical protein
MSGRGIKDGTKVTEKMTRKTNTFLIGLLGTILMGLSTWVLITLIEIQTIVSMMQNELMNIDKQFGRVYNFIDSVRTNIK